MTLACLLSSSGARAKWAFSTGDAAGQGGGISKARIYTANSPTAIAVGGRSTAEASCRSAADIAIDCACGGDTGQGTPGSPFNDLRIIATSNPAAGVSSCSCLGENVGTNITQRVVAIVTCLSR
jgi:hypothetical protein